MKTRFLYKGDTKNDSSKAYILKKLEKLNKHIAKSALVEIEINAEKKNTFRVEVMVSTEGQLYRAEEITQSIEGSIDIVVDELIAQIVKKQEKERDISLRDKRSLKKKLVIDKNARL